MTISVIRALDHERVAAALDMSSDELREHDRQLRPTARWLAQASGDGVLGVATAFVRADDRLFVRHELVDESAFEPLLRAACEQLDRRVNVVVRDHQPDRRVVAERLGFRGEMESRSYDVPFAAALHELERRRRPVAGVELVRSTDVDADELFALDIELRNDVPGNDGWQGRRDWFDDEMAAPEHDPAGYVVARAVATGELLGLCRTWRNDDGPALGMVGVVRRRRNGWLATALLDESLRAASGWGYDTCSVHTAHRSLHRRLDRLGAVRSGGFVRMARP